jgi:hypothetical protein
MGNQNSRQQQLEKRLDKLENNTSYEALIKLQDSEHQAAIEKLQAEIITLHRINDALESRLSSKKFTATLPSRVADPVPIGDTKILGDLSRAYIDEEINKIVANPDMNTILPDYLEKMLYRNVFNLLFGLLDNLTTNSSVKFLHHTITFNITADQPVADSLKTGNSKLITDDDLVDAVE